MELTAAFGGEKAPKKPIVDELQKVSQALEDLDDSFHGILDDVDGVNDWSSLQKKKKSIELIRLLIEYREKHYELDREAKKNQIAVVKEEVTSGAAIDEEDRVIELQTFFYALDQDVVQDFV